MGAMAELRPIIVIGSFMAIVFLLISIMPQGFFGSNNGIIITPTNTNFYSLLGTNDTITFNLTGSPPHDFGNKDFGGWHLDVQEVSTSDYGSAIWVQVADAWYGIFYNREDFKWFNMNNTEIDVYHSDIPDNTYPGKHYVMPIISIEFNSENQTELSYLLESTKTTIKVVFLYDFSTYASPLLAYDVGNLTMIVGIDFNERNTQINAWTVIGSFLTFQLIPNCDVILALFIEIPFWLAELYVVFIMVLRVIGAVFGGGGA